MEDFQDFGRISKISGGFSRFREDFQSLGRILEGFRAGRQLKCFVHLSTAIDLSIFMKSPDSVPGLEVMQCGAVLGLQDVQIQNHHSVEETDAIASILGRSG